MADDTKLYHNWSVPWESPVNPHDAETLKANLKWLEQNGHTVLMKQGPMGGPNGARWWAVPQEWVSFFSKHLASGEIAQVSCEKEWPDIAPQEPILIDIATLSLAKEMLKQAGIMLKQSVCHHPEAAHTCKDLIAPNAVDVLDALIRENTESVTKTIVQNVKARTLEPLRKKGRGGK